MDAYTLCATPPPERLEQLRREGWVDAHPTGVEVVINGKTVTRYALRRTADDRSHAPAGWWTLP